MRVRTRQSVAAPDRTTSWVGALSHWVGSLSDESRNSWLDLRGPASLKDTKAGIETLGLPIAWGVYVETRTWNSRRD